MRARLPVKVLAAALALLSLAALGVDFTAPAGEILRVEPFAGIWALGALALFWGYGVLCREKRAFSQGGLWLLSLLFAGMATLAQSFALLGTAELLTRSLEMKIKALLYFAGRVPLYYGAMALLQRALRGDSPFSGLDRAAPGESLLTRLAQRPWGVWALAALLLLCWLPYYALLFPGMVSNDSVTQLKQIHGLQPLSAGNPLFQTLLLGAFSLPLGPDAAVAAFCCVQALLMALVFAYTLRALAQAGSPRWVNALALGFFALCPIFPLYAFCIGKDANFATAVLYFMLMVWRALRQPGEQPLPRRYGVGLCVSAALLVLLRNPGIYLALLALALLLGYTLVTGRRRRGRPWGMPLAALAAVALAWGGLNLVLVPLMKPLPMPETENYSVPVQQVARTVASAPEALTEEERAVIDGVLELDSLKKEYNGELSDPVKNLWRPEATPAQKAAFWKTWLSLGAKHPATYFSAFFHNTYGYLYPGYVSVIKPTLINGEEGRRKELKGVMDFAITPRMEPLERVIDRLMGQPLFRLAIAPGLYGWIALFALVTLLQSRKKSLAIAALPALFALLGCLLSAVNGYLRYALPLYYCAVPLLALCAQALREPAPGAARPKGQAS